MANKQNTRTIITTQPGSSVINNTFIIPASNIVPETSTDGSASYEIKSDKFIVTTNNDAATNKVGRKAYYFYDYDFCFGPASSYGIYDDLASIRIKSVNLYYKDAEGNKTDINLGNYCDYLYCNYPTYKSFAGFVGSRSAIVNITKNDDGGIEFTVENDDANVTFNLTPEGATAELSSKITELAGKVGSEDATLLVPLTFYSLTLDETESQHKFVKLYFTDKQIASKTDYKKLITIAPTTFNTSIAEANAKVSSGEAVAVILNIHYANSFEFIKFDDSNERSGIILELIDTKKSLWDIFETGITDPGGALRRYSVSFPEYPDLGYSNINQFAVAIGANNTATGDYSFCVGNTNYALNSYAMALGVSNTSSNYASCTIGRGNTAKGENSAALGFSNIASVDNQFVVGKCNMEDVNCAFIVGNGREDNRNNALTVDWNGKLITNIIDCNKLFGGSVTRSSTYNNKTEATRSCITVSDPNDKNSNIVIPRIVIGSGTTNDVNGAIAIGHNCKANAAFAFVHGDQTAEASATYSFASGRGTKATADSQFVAGKYNVNDSNALFIVGDGTSDTNRHTMLTVGTDGVSVNGPLMVSTNIITAAIQLEGKDLATLLTELTNRIAALEETINNNT